MIHRVVIIFLLTSLNVHAALCQSPYVDSLENLVKSKIPDTVKVWALNELSREFIFGSPKESFRLANEALTLAQRIGYKRGEAYSYRVLASMSGAHDQYLPYSEYLQKGIKLFIELKDSVGLANCFITEAVVYNRQLNFEESIKSYKKAISIFRSANLEDRIAVCLSNMGFVFFRMENYPNAKESLVEAIAMKDAIDNTPTLMNAYNNLGLVELKLANIPSAEDYFEKVLSLNEALKDNSNSETYVETLIGLSDIYKLKGNPAQQEKYLGLARENAEQFQNLELMKEVYLRLAGYYLHKQNYEMARESFQNLSVTDDSITKQRRQNEATIISSVINSAKLETDFENAQDDLVKQELVIAQQSKTLVAMALLGVLFFVLLVLLYLINRNRTNMNNALTAHRLAIDNKNMELEKLNQTKDKFFSVVAHDMRSPMNSLFGFSKLLAKHADSMSKEEIKKMGEQLSESVSNTLKMTENLITWARSQMMLEQTNPEMISVSDAVNETIKVFLESAEKKGVSLNKAEMNGEHVYADKNHFLLILRNLISNAIKYTTSGDSICVSASQENGNTKIVVEDTGMGIEDDVKARLFSLEGTVSQVGTSGERGTGLGLVMCKDFAERNNGSIRVQSERRKGTSFVVLLPSAN